jgi:alpha-L-rhamnosidase
MNIIRFKYCTIKARAQNWVFSWQSALFLLITIRLMFAGSASAAFMVSATNQLGALPFTPTWTAAGNSLIAGLTPATSSGNFGEYTGANAVNLTKPGIPLTIYAYSSAQATNLEVCGNDGTAGSLLVYTLPTSTYGYDLTNITVYGGWQDGGRDAQDYTVYYSTALNPALFIMLTNVSFSPSNPDSIGCANRVTISDATGAAIARNVAAIKFDFTTPPSENSAVGYTAIAVDGEASTNAISSTFVITTSNQHSNTSFTPTWQIETDSMIAGQMPAVGPGNFDYEAGVTGVSALTDGKFGAADSLASYATCGSLAGQSVTYFLGAAMITNIVVYSGWPNSAHDGQFFNIYYSTVSAPTTLIPLTEISYNPGVTGISANRVAITTTNGMPLATNVALLEFDFTPQGTNNDNGYSGYAQIIVEGTNGTPATPIFGSSPMGEPYPYVVSGGLTGPKVPLSPDPLVAYRWANPQASDNLQIYLQQPKSVTVDNNSSFTNLQSLLTTHPNVTVEGLGSIQMDFGQENAAWIEFDSPDLPSTNAVTMSISEYNQPAIEVGTISPTRYGNTYRLELNSQLYEGVRFGWIHVNSFTSPWHITGIRAVCQTKPANYNGSFACSDPMFTRIWYDGAYDVKLNLEQNYIGAVLIDRGDRIAWTGDDHCSQAAALVAFGNDDFIKANINFTANNYNGIASYALYWVLSLLDYYNYTGDTAFLLANISNAQAVLDNAYAVYGTNPGLGFYGWDERLGAGFENPDCAESESAYQMLSIQAWSQFATAMATCGRTDLEAEYNGYATAKMAVLRQNPAWYQSYGLHAGSDAVNSGLLNATEKNAIFAQQFTDRVNRVSFSPFNQYFIIQAFAGMDKYDDALSSINDLWGSEINYGGTTFFEVSRPSWNAAIGTNAPVPNCQAGDTSLCHPWSAGVVKWLSEEVLGIKPTSPGFQTYQILPHLGSALTWVTGSTPTPFGSIQASFNVSNGLCAVSVPAGTVGTVGIPKVGKTINSITVNGAMAWNGTFNAVIGIGGASNDTDFVYFTGVKPGTYSMAVSYGGSTPAYVQPPEQYAAEFIRQDTNTSGNWGSVYGKDGYVLWDYDGNGSDIRSLPAYVSSVINNTGTTTVWATGTNDSRALSPNSSNGETRNAACIYNAPTMTFNINLTGTKNYQLALYFVDWDRRGRQVAVEMFDANTLNLVAPVEVVTNFTGGAYLVYAYTNSAKFRIDQVRGDNAVLSGIFFDPAPTNTVPVLTAISNQYVYVGQTVRLTVTATDAQSAYQTLTYSLTNSPASASIDPVSGAFSWGISNVIVPSTNLVTVCVTDNGIPPLSDAETFSVIASSPPRLTAVNSQTNDQVQISFGALPGQNYQVQFKDNLMDANWTSLGGLISGLGMPTNFYDDMSASPQRFYRLLASP